MHYLKNQKGSAMVLTLILVLVIVILGTAMLFSVASEVKINRAIEDSTIARYLAQAGIDHGLYLIENDSDLEYPYVKNVELGDESRSYKLEIEEEDDEILIKSKGIIKINGAVKQQVTLEATISEDGEVVVSE